MNKQIKIVSSKINDENIRMIQDSDFTSIDPNIKLLNKYFSKLIFGDKISRIFFELHYTAMIKDKRVTNHSFKSALQYGSDYGIDDKVKTDSIALVIEILDAMCQTSSCSKFDRDLENILNMPEIIIKHTDAIEKIETERRIIKELLFLEKYEILKISFKAKNKNNKINIFNIKNPFIISAIIKDLKFYKQGSEISNEWNYDSSQKTTKKRFFADRKILAMACRSFILENENLDLPQDSLAESLCDRLFDILSYVGYIEREEIETLPLNYIPTIFRK